jgi:Undecaprenyl-phosphate glucose phosphotransferase
MMGAWFIITASSHLLQMNAKTNLLEHLKQLFIAFSVFAVIVFGAGSHVHLQSQYGQLADSMVISFFMLAIYRASVLLVIKHLVKFGYQQKSVLLVGNGKITNEIITNILDWRNIGYRLYGILADEKKPHIPDAYYLGPLSKLRTMLRSYLVDEVIIAMSMKHEEKIVELVGICESEGIRVKVIPDFVTYMQGRVDLYHVGEVPLLSVRPEPLHMFRNRFLKRAFDIVFSLFGLVLLSPVMAIISAIIKLTSKGPILFQQERIGINNFGFTMYKFRTMHVQDQSASDTVWTSARDHRVTLIGRLLRKTSLDELPQLFNVLRGEMSLVGPRPERAFYVNQFQEKIPNYKVRHRVKSGITGWAQVNGLRGDTSIPNRVVHDIYYLENWSFWLDLKILLMTIFSSKTYEHAY